MLECPYPLRILRGNLDNPVKYHIFSTFEVVHCSVVSFSANIILSISLLYAAVSCLLFVAERSICISVTRFLFSSGTFYFDNSA